MKKPLLLIFTTLLFASCATVQQNGYIQSRTYKTKSLFAKKKKARKSNEHIELSELTTTKHQPNQTDTETPIEAITSTPQIVHQDVVAKQTVQSGTSDKINAPETATRVQQTPRIKRKVLKETLREMKKETRDEGAPNEEPTVHWAAIVGLITGILGFFIAALFFGLCAVVFSAIALSAIKNNPEKYKGKGMAIAGLVCGILALLIVFALVGLFVAV